LSEARVVVHEELGTVGLIVRDQARLDLISVAPHGAEFEAVEQFSTQRFAAMSEEEWTAVFQPDGQHRQRVKRQRERQYN